MLQRRRGVSGPAARHDRSRRSAAATWRCRPSGAPQLWPRLVAMMNRPELESDPRFATAAARRENWAALRADHLRVARPLQDGRGGGEDRSPPRAIPASAVLSPAEVVAHPHLAERQAFPEVDASRSRRKVRITAVPVPRRPPAGEAARRRAVSRGRAHARSARARCSADSRERIEELRQAGHDCRVEIGGLDGPPARGRLEAPKTCSAAASPDLTQSAMPTPR